MPFSNILKKLRQEATKWGLFTQVYEAKDSLLTILYISTDKNLVNNSILVYLADYNFSIYDRGAYYICPNRDDTEKIIKRIHQMGRRFSLFQKYQFFVVYPEYNLFPKFFKVFKVKKTEVKLFLSILPEYLENYASSLKDAKVFLLNDVMKTQDKQAVLDTIKQHEYIIFSEKKKRSNSKEHLFLEQTVLYNIEPFAYWFC